MMLVNPYAFGVSPTTVIDYQFNGTDGATTTTDSTGNTTASGLGIVSGSSFAYIQSNNLFARNNDTFIDNSGSLSPYLSFSSDFEVEVAVTIPDWSFTFGTTIWELEDGGGSNIYQLTAFKDGHVELTTSTALPTMNFAADINLAAQQVLKLARVGSTLSFYTDNVLKGSVSTSATISAGRFRFWNSNFERYVNYLRIKKA
jgi:hypothetical protein